MKRAGIKIMTPEERAARALFEQRSNAAGVAALGAALVRKDEE